jgi:hypothetical protein
VRCVLVYDGVQSTKIVRGSVTHPDSSELVLTLLGPLTHGRRRSSSTETTTTMPAMGLLTMLNLFESTLPVHWDDLPGTSTSHQGFTALSDPVQDVIHSAADTILECLKNERKIDFNKKKEIQTILGSI